MAARKQYVVTAAAVVAKVDSDTGEGYFYRDALLPDGVSAEECRRLVDLGLVKEVEDGDQVAGDTTSGGDTADTGGSGGGTGGGTGGGGVDTGSGGTGTSSTPTTRTGKTGNGG